MNITPKMDFVDGSFDTKDAKTFGEEIARRWNECNDKR